jgi:hypothetical protein
VGFLACVAGAKLDLLPAADAHRRVLAVLNYFEAPAAAR